MAAFSNREARNAAGEFLWFWERFALVQASPFCLFESPVLWPEIRADGRRTSSGTGIFHKITGGVLRQCSQKCLSGSKFP